MMGRESSASSLTDVWTDYFRKIGFTHLRAGDRVPIVKGVKVEVGSAEIKIHYPNRGKPDTLPVHADLSPWIDLIRKKQFVLLVTGPLLDLDELTDEAFDAILADGRAVAAAVAVDFVE